MAGEGRAFTRRESGASTVNKLFRTISPKYLFEVLVFDVARFADRISRTEERCLESPVWSHVRYVESRSEPPAETEDEKPEVEAYTLVLELVRRCCSIIIYKYEADHLCPATFFPPFFDACGQSLRRLELHKAKVLNGFGSLLSTSASRFKHLCLADIRHRLYFLHNGSPDFIVDLPHLPRFALNGSLESAS